MKRTIVDLILVVILGLEFMLIFLFISVHFVAIS